MFAGAAREAVFSKPDVVERINRDFIPVALKAGRVGNPPPGIEGDIYRHLKLTRAAPQGICVMNSGGKALAWSLMFENDAEVLNFLDYCQTRYAEFPDASKPLETERFHRFPGVTMPNIPDDGIVLTIPHAHSPHETCPGVLPKTEGAITARIVGRAFATDGKPVSDVRSQDNYIEDRFEILPPTRELFMAAIPKDSGRFAIPAEFARELAKHAHLGQLDIQPLEGTMIKAKTTKSDIALWAEKDPENPDLFRFGGHSRIAGHDAMTGRRIWDSEIDLSWEGFITVENGTISEIVAAATGVERLRWGNQTPDSQRTEIAVANLPGGSPIDFHGPVKYGIVGN